MDRELRSDARIVCLWSKARSEYPGKESIMFPYTLVFTSRMSREQRGTPSGLGCTMKPAEGSDSLQNKGCW